LAVNGRRQFDAVAAQEIEALEREGHAIYPWSQVDDLVLPLTIRHRGAHPLDERRATGSTVTPGSTAPVVSRTTPAIAGLALREGGTRRQDDKQTPGKRGQS
jgi:hypothetical protein